MKRGEQELYGRRAHPLVVVPLVVLLTILLATLGYKLLGLIEGEGWSMFDCLYMTVISLTTVGYGETLPNFDRVPYARTYTIFVLLVGYGVITWAVSTLIAVFVEGMVTESLARRRMMRAIHSMSDHYIVCGLGETGLHVLEELLATQREIVAVELDRERIQVGQRYGDFPFVEGDAEEDDNLLAAGIQRAHGLVACLPEDKDNLYLTLSARQLNPRIRIVARAVLPDSVEKLRRAGADTVVSPNRIGGRRIASELIRPHVVSFLDVMLRDRASIRVEEVHVPPGSSLIGRTIGEARVHERTGLLVLATQEPGQAGFEYNPGPRVTLSQNMTLIVLGQPDEVQRLRKYLEE